MGSKIEVKSCAEAISVNVSSIIASFSLYIRYIYKLITCNSIKYNILQLFISLRLNRILNHFSYYEILSRLYRDYIILISFPLFLKFIIRVHNIFTVASNNILDSKGKALVFHGKRLVRYLPMIQDVRIQQQEYTTTTS